MSPLPLNGGHSGYIPKPQDKTRIRKEVAKVENRSLLNGQYFGHNLQSRRFHYRERFWHPSRTNRCLDGQVCYKKNQVAAQQSLSQVSLPIMEIEGEQLFQLSHGYAESADIVFSSCEGPKDNLNHVVIGLSFCVNSPGDPKMPPDTRPKPPLPFLQQWTGGLETYFTSTVYNSPTVFLKNCPRVTVTQVVGI